MNHGSGAKMPDKEMCPRFGTSEQCDLRVVCQGCTPPSDEQIARRSYIPCCRVDLYDEQIRQNIGKGVMLPPKETQIGMKRYIIIPRDYPAGSIPTPSCDVFVKPGDEAQFEKLMHDARAGDRLQVFYMGRV